MPRQSEEEKAQAKEAREAARLSEARQIGMGKPAQDLAAWLPKETKPELKHLVQAASERGSHPSFRGAQDAVAWLAANPHKESSLSRDKFDPDCETGAAFFNCCTMYFFHSGSHGSQSI